MYPHHRQIKDIALHGTDWLAITILRSAKGCGVLTLWNKSHGAKNSGTSKFPAEVDHYYPPAGLSHGRPTARTDPCIHKDSIPRHMVAVFREGVFSSRKWSHMIIDAAAFVPAGGVDEGDKNYLGSEGEEEINETLYLEDDMELDDKSDLEVEFNWQDDISNLGAGTDWGPPVCTHRVALNLLQRAMMLSHRQYKSNTRLLSREI